jgi:2,3-bisphosphoglycerate-dependent phosphoglycerate mutase
VFQLLLIRHAQSANNALPESQRISDPGLTPLGHSQAAALADWLSSYRPTALICSGFRRALDTTRPIAHKLNLQPKVRWDLFEQGGCYTGYLPEKKSPASGMGKSEICKTYGDWDVDDRISDHGWYHGYTLESDQQARARAQDVATWVIEELVTCIREDQEMNRPALVIHADFKALLLEALLCRQQSPSFFSGRPYQVSEFWNASVTQLTWVDQHWRLDFWNSIGHLPADHWTR